MWVPNRFLTSSKVCLWSFCYLQRIIGTNHIYLLYILNYFGNILLCLLYINKFVKRGVRKHLCSKSYFPPCPLALDQWSSWFKIQSFILYSSSCWVVFDFTNVSVSASFYWFYQNSTWTNIRHFFSQILFK